MVTSKIITVWRIRQNALTKIRKTLVFHRDTWFFSTNLGFLNVKNLVFLLYREKRIIFSEKPGTSSCDKKDYSEKLGYSKEKYLVFLQFSGKPSF